MPTNSSKTKADANMNAPFRMKGANLNKVFDRIEQHEKDGTDSYMDRELVPVKNQQGGWTLQLKPEQLTAYQPIPEIKAEQLERATEAWNTTDRSVEKPKPEDPRLGTHRGQGSPVSSDLAQDDGGPSQANKFKPVPNGNITSQQAAALKIETPDVYKQGYAALKAAEAEYLQQQATKTETRDVYKQGYAALKSAQTADLKAKDLKANQFDSKANSNGIAPKVDRSNLSHTARLLPPPKTGFSPNNSATGASQGDKAQQVLQESKLNASTSLETKGPNIGSNVQNLKEKLHKH
jgi:hypothetical protein